MSLCFALPSVSRWLSKTRTHLLVTRFASRRRRALLLTLLNVWRCVLYHVKKVAAMTADSGRRRRRGLLRRALRAISSRAKRSKGVFRFTLRRYVRRMLTVFSAWKVHSRGVERQRLLLKAASRSHARSAERRALGRLSRLAAERGKAMRRASLAEKHIRRRRFEAFKREVAARKSAAARKRERREKVAHHLLTFVVRRKILPAWRLYAGRSAGVRNFARYFTLSHYWREWGRFANGERKGRAARMARRVRWSQDRVRRAFDGWTAFFGRSARLKECESYLSEKLEKASKRWALTAWRKRLLRARNCRKASAIVSSRRGRKLALGACTVWRSGAVHRRFARTSALLSVWRAFCGGAAGRRRSRENKERADRWLYAKSVGGGFKKLKQSGRLKGYLRACGEVADGCFFKNAKGRGLRTLRERAEKRKRDGVMFNRGAKRRAFRILKKGVEEGKSASKRKLLGSCFEEWRDTATREALKREGKLDVLRGAFDATATRLVWAKWIHAVAGRRRALKAWWIKWLVWVNERERERERACGMADRVDEVILKSKWRAWKALTTLASFEKNKGARKSTKLILRR